MKTRTKMMWPLFLAAGISLFSFACKKSASDEAMGVNNDSDMITVSGRTATGGRVAVQIPRPLMQQAKAGQRIQLASTGANSFTATKVAPAAAVTSRGDFEEVTFPTDCPPVPQETLDYYQKEANACCCSFAVCLIGEDCYFYFYYFSPSNGCGGGGNEM